MGSSNEKNFPQPPPLLMLPPRPRTAGAQPSSSIIRPQARRPTSFLPELGSRSNLRILGSSSITAGSRRSWSIADTILGKRLERERARGNASAEHSVNHQLSISDKMCLQDIAGGKVDMISDRMKNLSVEFLEGLKKELRVLVEGTTSNQQVEFSLLQNLIEGRDDLTENTLIVAHRVQLEIFVAIRTGIQAFLHPCISLSIPSLIEVFLFKKCRNLQCQSHLPAVDCACAVCAKTNGFCNLCMCVNCMKFDFEGNTCRWIGCDFCSHWSHTECATREGQIGMNPDVRSAEGSPEILFRCGACNNTSALLGWVKDLFQSCAQDWNRDTLMRELETVSRIFRNSVDSHGRRLFWASEDIIEKMKIGMSVSAACSVMLFFFQELEMQLTKRKMDEIGQLASPQDAYSRIAAALQDTIKKMDKVAEEGLRMVRKARLDVESCERELEEKGKEVIQLEMERRKKREQTAELETIVRLKEAEADMFEKKAVEARREAERLQHMAEKKRGKGFLQLRLSEAEKKLMLEKVIQERARASEEHPPPPPPPPPSSSTLQLFGVPLR